MCIGYRDLTLLSLLTAPAAMLTVSGRDYVNRPTHEIGAELDCRAFMVASAGGTDRDLAAPQFRRNWGAVQYKSILIILKLKL